MIEKKIKSILRELIGDIDGDWAVFMSPEYYDEMAEKYGERIMDEIKKGDN